MISIYEYDLHYLQKLQNRGMRIILRCNKRTKIKDMLEALRFMSIKQRIEYNVYILVFKIINEKCPKYLSNYIHLVQNEEMITRQRSNVYIRRCKTREEQRMVLYEGLRMFNNLPHHIKMEKELHKFRKLIVQYIRRGV